MKILLLNPPAENTILEYPSEEGKEFIETEDFGYFPPLGLLYVIAYLEKNTSGHQIYFKDCVAEKISYEKLTQIIKEIKPALIGMTSFTISLIDILKTTKIIRETSPSTHICLGGHHPIAFPFEAAQLKDVDSILVGEGEISFTELVKSLENKEDFTKIKGIYTASSIEKYKNNNFQDNRFLTNVMVEPAYIENINTLPFPSRKHIKHIKYSSILGLTNNLATIITSRGCPYRCTFCDVPYKRYRERKISNVIDEVEDCLQSGYKEFHFYDDLFNITPEKVINFCNEVEKRKLKFHWDFRGRVNTATKESLARAKKAGCRLISFGVETGTNQGLKLIKKNTSVEKISEVFKWCKELGVKTVADYMIGFPFEKTKDAIKKNIDFLIGLDPDYAQISILGLFPNTELYNQAIDKGLIKKGKWEAFALNPTQDFSIDHWEEFLSTKEVVALQKKGYKQYYLRPKYIIRNIFNTRSIYEFKTKAKGLLKLIK